MRRGRLRKGSYARVAACDSGCGGAGVTNGLFCGRVYSRLQDVLFGSEKRKIRLGCSAGLPCQRQTKASRCAPEPQRKAQRHDGFGDWSQFLFLRTDTLISGCLFSTCTGPASGSRWDFHEAAKPTARKPRNRQGKIPRKRTKRGTNAKARASQQQQPRSQIAPKSTKHQLLPTSHSDSTRPLKHMPRSAARSLHRAPGQCTLRSLNSTATEQQLVLQRLGKFILPQVTFWTLQIPKEDFLFSHALPLSFEASQLVRS